MVLPRAERDGSVGLSSPVRGELRFEEVCLSFGAKPVLSDFSLTIGARETIALVGASGAGKSAVANLLLRFLAPDRGLILLDGYDLAQLRLADLRRAICVAEQDPFIFSGSILDNIRYGAWDPPRSRIDEAGTPAGREPHVASLPHRLETLPTHPRPNLSAAPPPRITRA